MKMWLEEDVPTPVIFIEGKPSDFWVQIANEDVIFALQKRLQSALKTPKRPPIKVGDKVLVRWSVDSEFYRALIIEELLGGGGGAGAGSWRVRFLDYGNVDTVLQDDIYELNTEFRDDPPQAVRCCLRGLENIDPNYKWPHDVVVKFTEISVIALGCGTAFFRRNIKNKHKADFFVRLKYSVDVLQYLISKKVIEVQNSSSTDDEAAEKVPVVFLDGIPSDFFIRKESSDFQGLQERIQWAATKRITFDLFEIRINQDVLVKSEGVFYRGLIVSYVSKNSWNILLIDAGTTKTVDNSCIFKSIPGFENEAPMALRCSLRGLETKLWNSDEIDIFKTFLSSGSVTATFTKKNKVTEYDPDYFVTLHSETDAYEYLEALGLIPSSPVVVERSRQKVVDWLQQNIEASKLKSESVSKTKENKFSVTVPERDVSELCGEVEIMITNLISPAEFYINLRQDVKKLENLLLKMKRFYDGDYDYYYYGTKEWFSELKSVSLRTFVVVRTKDGSWMRAIITEINKDEVQVRFIDSGEVDSVHPKNIRPLKKAFEFPPAFALQSKLYNLCPPSSQGRFSEEASKCLKELFPEGVFHEAEILKTKRGSPLNLLLWIDDFLVQEIFEEEGLGIFDLFESESGEEWDFMEKDYMENNTLDYRSDNVDQVMGKYNSSISLCKFIQANKPCPHRDTCQFSHHLRDNLKIEIDNLVQQIPLPKIDSIIPVHITTVWNPESFYIIMPWGNGNKRKKKITEEKEKESLESLNKAITDYYKTQKFAPHSVPVGFGELVAARFPVDGRWYRARVISIEETSVRVFFIDFGNTAFIENDCVRTLESRFQILPAQAVKCSLDKIKPLDGSSWSISANTEFHKFTQREALYALIKGFVKEDELIIDLISLEEKDGRRLEIDAAEQLINNGLALKDYHRSLLSHSLTVHPG